jgi:predicted GNAT family acetyltransferase
MKCSERRLPAGRSASILLAPAGSLRTGRQDGSAPNVSRHYTGASMSIAITNNRKLQRYEANVEGGLAFVDYHRHGQQITFSHTEVPKEAEGKGVAAALAKFAFEDARQNALEVFPICPYIVSYLKRHREYLDVVAHEHRRQFD